MNIHEYQAKELLRLYKLPIPKGFVFQKKPEKISYINKLKGPPWVVKSQIHAGGRGSGYFLGQKKNKGGVSILNNLNDVEKEIEFMLGKKLITKQTGPEGKQVNTVYVEEGCKIKKEIYLSLIIDRKFSKIMLMVSDSGGMDIEEVATNDPDKIIYYYLDDSKKINIKELKFITDKLSFTKKQEKEFFLIIEKLLKIFNELDASTIEINPLAITEDNTLILLDTKMSFDDNALFRHPEILKLRDESEEDPMELKAAKNNMNYVKLDGSIGCMVNGAGLAMATMDIIKLYGGNPANFLDLGGTADKERTIQGFKIIQSDPNVKVILINIFGGIIQCDMIAQGIISAAEELKLKLPIVIRFEGTNAKQGREVINKSKLNIIAANSLNEAAKKSVEKINN